MNDVAALPALLPALPEIVLALGAMALLMLGAFRGERTRGRGQLAGDRAPGRGRRDHRCGCRAARWSTFGGSFVVDPFARFLKLLALTGSAVAILMSLDYLALEKQQRFEYPILILLSTTGMLMLISAADLIALYLGLELMSLALYVVAAIDRDSARSTEAGLKYFVLGALSSGMLLYGASLVYGFTGTVSFAGIAKAASRRRHRPDLRASCSCSPASASRSRRCRSTCGRPTSTRARRPRSPPSSPPRPRSPAWRCSCAPPSWPFPASCREWQQIVVFVAIASMALGAFAAIGQRNIKRLMAYSSIGHMGFALIGLAAGTAEGVQGVLVYMAIYRRHDARHLRLHPVDAARRPAWSRRSATSPASPAPTRRWRSSSRCCCSRSPASRRSPASSRSSTCSSPPSRPACSRSRSSAW